jgi:hypothetical protein
MHEKRKGIGKQVVPEQTKRVQEGRKEQREGKERLPHRGELPNLPS